MKYYKDLVFKRSFKNASLLLLFDTNDINDKIQPRFYAKNDAKNNQASARFCKNITEQRLKKNNTISIHNASHRVKTF